MISDQDWSRMLRARTPVAPQQVHNLCGTTEVVPFPFFQEREQLDFRQETSGEDPRSSTISLAVMPAAVHRGGKGFGQGN